MVIASSGWMQNATDSEQEKIMSATGILICHDNSYPFQERTLSLEQPIKIGRSVARARAANDNAIFDCKVLSRNHALLCYLCGKFYLKDTKSSNGTFVNNKRLSPSGEESVACEVYSGDVVQFGVDVVESTKKVTHGCIVATLKLYLPDGKEAKASFSNSVAYVNVTLEDLYKLNQFIQEAGRREQALRSKLEYMQQLLDHTRTAANQSWKALVLEDCLLSRLEMLESQVFAYSKNFGEDRLRIELMSLLEDKAQYQNATKELLQKKVQEKREIIGKVQILKCRLSETEEEKQSLHNIIKDNQSELQELAIKYIKIQQTLQDTTDKLNRTKNKLTEVIQQSEHDKQDLIRKLEDQKSIERNLQISLRDSKLDKVHIHKQISALRNYIQTLQDIKYITNESADAKDHANPVDAINIILSKWSSMYIEILDNNIQIKDHYQENQTNFFENDLKFQKSFCIDNHYLKNDYSVDTTTIESIHNKYILPPTSNKILLTNNSVLGSKNQESEFKNNFLITDASANSNIVTDSDYNVQKNNGNISVSNVSHGISNHQKENIASVKLIMRFSSNKADNIGQEILESNNLKSEVDCLGSQNLLIDSLSTKIITAAQQRNSASEDVFEQNESDLKNINLLNKYIIEKLNLSENKLVTCENLPEFIMHNLMYSSNTLKRKYDYENHVITEELQDLKKWLLCEPNEVIINKFRKYYHQLQNDTQQQQELSEQLVILKEKYNSSIEEKANIIRKYINLEAQCKNVINTNFMVPVYYFIPIIFGFIWMLLEKLL